MGIFYFAAFWVQPLIWMPLWFVKTRKLDDFARPLTLTGLFAFLVGISPNPSLPDAIHLILFYYALGVGVATYLSVVKEWAYVRALSTAFMVVFAGSFYWEVPYILRNAALVGFEWDWMVHIIGIIPILFIKDYIGWNLNRRNLALVGVGLLISVAVMLVYPIAPGTGTGVEWNSPLYLFNRAACTLILFNAMNRDWGKLK
jgi:hypothetical protein